MTRWTVYDGRGNDWCRSRWHWTARLRRRLMDPLGRFTHIWQRPTVSAKEIRRTVKISGDTR